MSARKESLSTLQSIRTQEASRTDTTDNYGNILLFYKNDFPNRRVLSIQSDYNNTLCAAVLGWNGTAIGVKIRDIVNDAVIANQ